MAKLTKLTKVNDTITVHRYDNGWMVEVSGYRGDKDWTQCKIICNVEDEVLAVIKEWNTLELGD